MRLTISKITSVGVLTGTEDVQGEPAVPRAAGIARWSSEAAFLIVFTITNGPCSVSPPPPVVCKCIYVCMITFSCRYVHVCVLLRLTGTLGYASLLGTNE